MGAVVVFERKFDVTLLDGVQVRFESALKVFVGPCASIVK